MMLTKKEQRLRRARQTRIRIATQGVARLTVNRTNLHIYASLISDDGSKVLATASTVEADDPQGTRRRRQGCHGRRRAADRQAHRREGESRRRREGRLRPRRFRLPRPRQGAGRSGPRSRPAVLTDTETRYGKDSSETSG
jgi:hypothetical protein